MKRILFPWPAVTVLLLAACSAGEPATPQASSAAVAAPTASAEQCPESSFEQFLEQFSSQVSVQETATADPLSSSHINADAQPEPALETQQIPLAEVVWPVMPNLTLARRAGRDVQLSGEGQTRVVTVSTPDTSDQQRYHFQRQPCWTLVKREDQSI